MFKCVVSTPPPDSSDKSTYNEVYQVILREFKNENSWTDECTTILQNCPKLLFGYDRLQYGMAKAFGCNRIKILLNPLMVLCYHPDCVEKETPPIRLSSPCSLHAYLLHLTSHLGDEVGKSTFGHTCRILSTLPPPALLAILFTASP